MREIKLKKKPRVISLYFLLSQSQTRESTTAGCTEAVIKEKILKCEISLVGFYGISTIAGYSMPNPLYTYILNIYDL